MRHSVTGSLLLTFCALLISGRLTAQESTSAPKAPTSDRFELRQIYVPADAPDAWPAGDWVSVDRDELLDLLRHPQPSADPEPAFLEQAVYRARLEGPSLVDGTLTASARLRGTRSRFLDLGSPNLAIAELRWEDRPAIWGLAADGRSLLRIDADRQTLTGRWSLAGRTVFSTVEFEVNVVPAVVSRIEIDAPAGLVPGAGNGLIVQVSPGAAPDRQTWSIDLGRRTSCRLTISPDASSKSNGDRELILSQSSNYTFIAEGLRLQSDVTVQSIDGTFDSLEFTVPPRMQFSPVVIGNETALPTETREDANASLLVVDVRGVELTRGTTLRLTGHLPVRSGPSQSLPRIGVRGARWLRIRKHVDVARPLQLQEMTTSGALLADASIGPDTGAALDFDILTDPSRISLSVGTPQPDLTASILAQVDWSSSDPLLHQTVQLAARSGSTYTVVCDVPSGWEVTRVTADSTTPVAQWQTTHGTENEPERLQIELRKALTPQNPVDVAIWARPLSLLSDDMLEVPVVLPLVSGERGCEILLTPPRGIRLRPASDSAYRPIDVDGFLEEHPSLAARMTGSSRDGMIALKALDPPDTQMLIVERDTDSEPLDSAGLNPAAGNFSHWPNEQVGLSTSSHSTDAPLMMPLTVSTVVAVDRGRLCRHRVMFAVPPLRAARLLALQLPENATFLKCDGCPCRRGDEHEIVVNLTASTSTQEPTDEWVFSITYETPLSQSIIGGQADVGLPSWNGEATTIGWEIQLPAGYRLRAPTTGTSARSDQPLTWSQRLLGPLGSTLTNKLFWPFSRDAWRELWEGRPGEGPESRGEPVLLRSTVGGHAPLQLSFWNVSAARQVGWLVLFFSLLLLAWPFRPGRLISPGWALKLILLGCAAALIAPEFLAIPWGGFVVGAALGALLPDSWRRPAQQPAVRSDSKQSTQMALPLAATAGIVVLCLLFDVSACLGWQLSNESAANGQGQAAADVATAQFDVLVPLETDSVAESDLPQVVYVERSRAQTLLGHRLSAAPVYLIRSAHYDVDALDDAQPSLTAGYEVVLLQPQTETSVAVDLTGVLFDDDRACEVNGKPAPLLPRRGRDGVVVVVPPMDADKETAGAATATIRLACRPRPSDQESPWIDVGIPAVIDSRLTIAKTEGDGAMMVVGRMGTAYPSTEGGRWQFALGPRRFLSVHPEVPGLRQRWAVPIEAASVVEAHPLRLQIESRLTFAIDRRWSHLDEPSLLLRLPPHSIVRSVRANGLQQTQTHRAADGAVELLLTFQTIPDRELAVALSLDVAATPSAEESGTTIPALPFLEASHSPGFPVHLLGIAASRGLRLSAGDPEGMMPGTTGIDESRLPEWRGNNTSRTVEATYQLGTPHPLVVPLAAIAPDVSATVRQTLTVRPSVIDWSAEVDLTTRDAAVAYHRVAVDPRINVRSVNLLQDDVDRLASWTRTSPEELILFMTEELIGTQSLRMSGSLDVEDRQDFALPRLAVPSSTLATPAEVRVRRTPDVAVVLTSEEGTLVSANPSSTAGDDGLMDLATVNMDETLPPLRIRGRREDSVLDVEQATIIRSVDGGMVDWSYHLQIAAAGMLPTEMEVLLKGEAANVAVSATVPVHDAESQDGKRRWTLGPTTTAVDSIEVTIHGQTPVATGKLPEVGIDQGRLTRQVVITLGNAGVELAQDSLSPLPAGDLPQWLSDATRTAAATGQVYEMTDPRVPPTVLAGADAAVLLKNCDSAIWQQSGVGWSGVTIADAIMRTEGTIAFSLPEGLTLRWASLDGNNVTLTDNEVLNVTLEKSEQPQRLILWWAATARPEQGIPLPRPVDVETVAPNVVVFGDQQRHYEFGPTAENVGAAALLSRLSARNAAAAESSPIVTAMRNAGVVPGSAVGDVDRSSHVFGIRLAEDAGRVPLRLLDEQLLRIIRVLVAGGILLALWYVFGRWVEQISPVSTMAPGLLGLMTIAAIIWIAGASFVGFVLFTLLTAAWLFAMRPGTTSG